MGQRGNDGHGAKRPEFNTKVCCLTWTSHLMSLNLNFLN